ncbi:hypothetical protein CTAYLR_008608 [Chrysophaeum taylorii]|uniref:JmjC domain-containing protein n=1 Tax=Chrysophaeum taylorii TaxID=2483200 RepID=A0AAD7XP70_9STRA|nr:hypothetical protein CTAYLR_008608 [Chrysophaeum taylorii]
MWRVKRGVLSESTIDALRAEAEALAALEAPSFENGCVLEPVRDDVRGEAWRADEVAYGLARKVAPSAAVREALFETLARVASEFFGEAVVLFNEHYVVKPANSEVEFGWHRDGDLQLASTYCRDEYVSCWCALDPATPENGCLVVRDGALPCAAGDVVVLSSRCEHRSGPNETPGPRRAFYAQYASRPIATPSGVLRLAIPCRGGLTLADAAVCDLERVDPALATFARLARDLETDRDAWRAVLDGCWAALHDPDRHWTAAPREFRRAYAVASIYYAETLDDSEEARIRSLDLGLMMDDGSTRAALLERVAELERQRPPPPPRPLFAAADKGSSPRPLTGTVDLPTVEKPSVETFRVSHFEPRKPCRILEAMPWPALRKWRDLDYLRRVAGHRVVPIEIGDHYLADDWTEKVMTLSEFVETRILGQEKIGYLAQHALFDQVPALRADVALPDYCALGDGVEPRLNAWFGPPGTVSPLHHDRYHNLLCQVLGVKYVRLYAPRLDQHLYPRDPASLHAVSSQIVDIDRVDQVKFPRFKDAPYSDCRLAPGEILYIPPHTWHYIEASETSFSVGLDLVVVEYICMWTTAWTTSCATRPAAAAADPSSAIVARLARLIPSIRRPAASTFFRARSTAATPAIHRNPATATGSGSSRRATAATSLSFWKAARVGKRFWRASADTATGHWKPAPSRNNWRPSSPERVVVVVKHCARARRRHHLHWLLEVRKVRTILACHRLRRRRHRPLEAFPLENHLEACLRRRHLRRLAKAHLTKRSRKAVEDPPPRLALEGPPTRLTAGIADDPRSSSGFSTSTPSSPSAERLALGGNKNEVVATAILENDDDDDDDYEEYGGPFLEAAREGRGEKNNKALRSEELTLDDETHVVTTPSSRRVSTLSDAEEPSSSALADSGTSALDEAHEARVRCVAETVRMRLAEVEQRTVESAARSASLGAILRACLFAHGRQIVGDGKGTLASDWARDEVMGRAFRQYADDGGRIGLAEWLDFVGDARCCGGDVATKVFRVVALERAAGACDDGSVCEDDARREATEALVASGVHDVQLDFSGFYGLLRELVERRRDTFEAFAHAYVVPVVACGRGAARASPSRLVNASDAPRVARLARDFLPNLWRLFTLYAQDERGHTAPACRGDFPHLAQAAEHAIAGTELADFEPLSADFASMAARIQARYPDKRLALSVSEDRFARVCEHLALAPDVAPLARVRLAFRVARRPRVEAARPKAPTPKRAPRVSRATRPTVAHKRRVLAVAAHTSLLHSSPTRFSPKRSSPVRLSSPNDDDAASSSSCCPGLSFCEFVEALADVADAGLSERKVLAKKYPTTYARVAALLAVWGAADARKLDDLAACIASHLSERRRRR